MMKKRAALVFVCLASAASPAAAEDFAAGSLIIPASATYQTDCGAVSMYGLAYDILRANQWLEDHRATACPGYPNDVTCRIELHFAYKSDKLSPNRCIPTNISTPPTDTSNPKWLDGCDFEIGAPGLPDAPVKLVNNADPLLATGDGTLVTNKTASSGSNPVYPNWASTNVAHTTKSATDVNIVRYWGGSFVIDDADAVTLRKLLRGNKTGGLVAKDATGANIDFTPFVKNDNSGASSSGDRSKTTCLWGTTAGGTVAIHSAQYLFSAPVGRVLSAPPPRLALLATNGNGSKTYTGRVDNGILQTYLKRAGLDFTGAGGSPTGTAGQIYDEFSFKDLYDGKLTATPGKYKMMWAPHWALDGSSANSYEKSVISDELGKFLQLTGGLMAECAAIQSLEGSPKVSNYSPSSDALVSSDPAGRLLTCTKNAAGTACVSTTTSAGLQKASAEKSSCTGWCDSDPGGTSGSGTTPLQNCTDPNLSNGVDCMFFNYPGDPFSQTADYQWRVASGEVSDFWPNSKANSMYQPGVKPLVSGVTSLDKTKLAKLVANPRDATGRTMIKGDHVARGFKDNDPNKANILYLGGHDYSGTVAGTKIVLQTLLQLGDPPPEATATEIARANPISYDINGTAALIQGSYVKVTPPGTPPTLISDASAADFRFPYVQGHMRAVAASNVDTNATSISNVTAIFDAATTIPTPNYSGGCGSNAFKGTCRTVFTNTSPGFNPPRVLLQQSNRSSLISAMASGITLTTANQDILISRVLAGTQNTSGTFVPQLGGVDRSTVAVIPTSLVAGTARPTMVYFGARDGMLHAVCGGTLGGSVCPSGSLGREVWAFIPRTQLPKLRLNQARVEGSPRVVELFGDFTGSGNRSFRTVLIFQTGSGDPSNPAAAPSVYALDVTNPSDPTLLWEYSTEDASSNYALGAGLNVTVGKVVINGVSKYAAFAQTANGGVGGVGSVVTAIDVETGTQLWQTGYAYANPPRGIAADAPLPSGGIPGGAIAVDRNGTGLISDVVFGTLYGDVWQLDATDGQSRHGTNPLFRFTTNKKPFGAPPTLFASGGTLYAVAASGGYVDLAATLLWSGTQHQAVALALNTPSGSAPLTEGSAVGGYLKWKFDLDAGQRSFSQAVVVNGQLFLVSDGSDVNADGFGGSDTGRLYRLDVATGAQAGTTVVLDGGASSVAASGSTIYSSSGSKVVQITGDATGSGEAVNNAIPAKVSRKLWMRTL